MLYLDSSAIVKLISPEPETEALTDLLVTDEERISSVLSHVEVLRAVGRLEKQGGPLFDRARRVLARIALIRIDRPVLRAAAELEPPGLGTLDAVHLATALSITTPVKALVTYDARMRAAAREAGMNVESPA